MDMLDPSAATRNPGEDEQAIVQLLLEALPSSALVINPQGKVAALNQQAEVLLGWGAPVLEGQPAHEILECRYKDTVDASVDCPVASVLKGISAAPSGQMLIRCRDNGFRPVEYRCIPYPMLTGLGAILALRDLTRQMELEKDLHRLASMAEESPIPIVELNEDANLIYANPSMMLLVERFGFSSAARPLILPANITKLTAQCLHTHKEVAGIDVSVGGNHYEWKLVPIMREKLVRGYGIDLTARKRAEVELTRAKAQAEVASQAKSKFLANMSDEIRAPIDDIMSKAELLAASGLNHQQLEYTRTVKSRSAWLRTAIDDILGMAALESGKITVEKNYFDFRAFMDKTIASLIRRAEIKGLQLTVTISHRVPAQVQCDSGRLGQLLLNLLSHAINFTERGEVVVEVDRDTISTRPNLSFQETENSFYLFFTIRDSGIAIPRQEQEIVFDQLAQADGSNTSRPEETGLGLELSKQLVELMGGTIRIESEPGKGIKFWFSLPMQDLGRTTRWNNEGSQKFRNQADQKGSGY